jgi:pre-rRNA-processing protein TSR1
MEAEQTWPEEEEMEGEKRGGRRRLPAGTSDYQACWILDDEANDDSGDDGSGNDSQQGSGSGAMQGGAPEVPELESAQAQDSEATWVPEGTEVGGEMDVDDTLTALDLQEAQRMREDRRRHAADDDLNFPDEVEAPHDSPCAPCACRRAQALELAWKDRPARRCRRQAPVWVLSRWADSASQSEA